MQVEVTVNGEVMTLPPGTTLADLVARLGLAKRRVAAELNLEVVPRSDHDRTVLAEGDRLEIVSFVGGG